MTHRIFHHKRFYVDVYTCAKDCRRDTFKAGGASVALRCVHDAQTGHADEGEC